MVGLFKKKETPKNFQVVMKPKASVEKLKKYYDKALRSHNEGKENQAKYYIKRIISDNPDNINLITDTLNLILKIQYDDYEDDGSFCHDKIIELDPNNKTNWIKLANFFIEHLTDYGGAIDTLNTALTRYPRNERLLEMKCDILIECDEGGLEILKTLKVLKQINPSNNSIQEFKEAAIEILIAEEEDSNPEALDLIEKI